MRYWKAATYGGLAGLPWAFLIALVLWVWLFRSRNGALLFVGSMLTGTVIGVPLGAIGGVLLVRFQNRMLGNSTFVKAAIISLIAWALSVGIGSVDIFHGWFVAFTALSSLAGVILWASLVSNFIDSDTKSQKETS